MKKQLLAVSALALVATSAATAQGSADAPRVTVSEGAKVTLSATSLRPGYTTFAANAASKGDHSLMLARLRSKGSLKPLIAALAKGDFAAAEKLVVMQGGIEAGSELTVDLKPGAYVALDDSAKKPSYATFEVSGAPTGTAAPASVGRVRMFDYGYAFALPKGWNGTGTIRVSNTGTEEHELVVFPLAKGQTLQDVLALLKKGPSGPPPKGIRLLATGVAAHSSVYVSTGLARGRYAAVCFIPSAKHHEEPHAALGMIGTFTVA